MNIFKKFLQLFGFGEHEWYRGPKKYKDATKEATNVAIGLLKRCDGIDVKMKWDKWVLYYKEPTNIAYYTEGRPVVKHKSGNNYLGWFDNVRTIYIPKGAWFNTLVHEMIHYLCQANGVSIEDSQGHRLKAFREASKIQRGRKIG